MQSNIKLRTIISAFTLFYLMLSNPALSQVINTAAEIGDMINVKELLRNDPESVNEKNKYGLAPLHYAALYGHKDIAELLISHGADIQMKLNDGTTPLHLAVGHGYPDIAEVLIENGADIQFTTNFHETPLHHAAYGGDKQSAELLLENGASINAKNEDGRTPLYFAVTRGKNEIIDLLLEEGAFVEINNKGSSDMLHGAVSCGYTALTELMINKGENIYAKNKMEGTLLHSAAQGGNSDIISFLISRGFDINAINNAGRTPIFYAVREGHFDITELLIEHGATLNMMGNDERNLLHIAEDNGHKEIAELLITKGIEKVPRRIYRLKDKKDSNENPPDKQMNIYYIGNEGFLIINGSKKIMIDAIHTHPWYSYTSEKVLQKMMNSQPPFNDIDLLLITHSHSDHFNPELTVQYLLSNPATILVSDSRVTKHLQRVMKEDYNEIRERVINVDIKFGEFTTIDTLGIRVKALGLSHGYPDYLNLGFVVHFDDITIFHPGDMHTDLNSEYLQLLEIENENIDIVFRAPVPDSPLWKDNKPQYYIPMHIRPENLESRSRKILDEYADAIIFKEAMEMKVFISADERKETG